ncbi:AMP-dependent synthetase/ligase [Neofusicoccum parvum]|uniref:AMP-dependent synthetase/ligase n=1 Tax=Neofusicoccum parvum TaxID=310453 RepID=A0ACB5RXQ4_9PEZI|nr:AMP-dependent synthetase/ligase [Neofusicoccum parvum]
MYFTPPSYIPQLPFQPPDTVPIHDFLFNHEQKYGRHPIAASKPAFTCGTTGKSYSVAEVTQRIEHLARALSAELGWQVNAGDPMDKVLGIFSLNSIDAPTASWAAHRLSGVSCPISAGCSAAELARQLRAARCKALFTCAPLLGVALAGAAAAGLPPARVYLVEVPAAAGGAEPLPQGLRWADDLVAEGARLPPLEALRWARGQGARQPAFLCSSSGSSGLPKNVMISHRNVIANVVQRATFESTYRGAHPETCLGVLPQSHIYALVVITHASLYRGDGVVVLQRFDLQETLQTIQDFRIERLWMVPAMIVAMTKASAVVKKYDLSSVKIAAVGASPLSREVVEAFAELVPGGRIIQGYGLTEAGAIVTFTNADDLALGSCGSLYPGFEARLVDESGRDVEKHGQPGELLIRSPSIMMGYFGNDAATRETLTDDGWLRTGDLGEFRVTKNGHDHLFIVDRVKELIKVRGLQVAPAELENNLLQHPAVADVSVIPVPDESSGELPMAFVVKSAAFKAADDDALRRELHNSIESVFSAHKRLAGGIDFVDSLPKTTSGKTQRKVLKERVKTRLEERKRAAEVIQKKAPVVIQVFEFDSDESDDDSNCSDGCSDDTF